MAGRREQRVQVLLATALVLGGAWLLYSGASYVSAWLTFEAQRPPAPTCTFCQRITEWGLVPSPFQVAVSYLVAIPSILGIAWWTHQGSQLHPPEGQTVARVRRAGSDSLIGVMGWMALLIALGTVWPGWVAPPYPSILWSVFLVSILVVPLIVMGVGVALLWDTGRRRSHAPSRAVGG
jgi:hypothetical protein